MRLQIVALVCVLGLSVALPARHAQTPAQTPAAAAKSHRLEALTWQEAEGVLTPETVVLIPLGAGSKEHGPHLKLRNDLTLAEYLTGRVADAAAVVVAPTLTYHFYPAFLEYPGSTSLSLASARDMTADVVRTLAAYGPRRFYILNTGVSTVRALDPAVALMASEGVLVRYTNLATRLDPATKGFVEQEGGTHADEVETSMMLYIDPSSVDMSKAVKDYTPSSGGGRLTRQRGGTGTYSPTGTWGDPTRATREKGRVFVEALVAGIVGDITALRTATAADTHGRATAGTGTGAIHSAADRARSGARPAGALLGRRRTLIVAVGNWFSAHWNNRDYEALGALWSTGGDIVHPDGAIERGAQAHHHQSHAALRPARVSHPRVTR